MEFIGPEVGELQQVLTEDVKMTRQIRIPVLSRRQMEAEFILEQGREAFRERPPIPEPIVNPEAESRTVPGYGFETGNNSPIGMG